MNRRSLIVLSITLLGTVLGGASSVLLGHLTLGIAVGTLAGIALGAFIATHRRRWLAVGLLNIQILLAFVVGDIFGLAFTAIAVALAFFIASAVLAELYGGGEFHAILSHLRLVFGAIQGFQIVDDSTPVGSQGGKPLFGPRLLIVRPGRAVVLEQGARRRVIHPRITTTAPFEYVKHVHNLEDAQTAHSFQNALTQDLVSTTVQLTAQYRLNVSDGARRGLIPLTPAEDDLLQRVPLAMPGWETALKTVLEQCTRQEIGTHQFDALVDGRALAAVERAILNRVRTRTAGWGIIIEQIIVQGVSAKSDIADAMEARRKERERAMAMQDALAILANGYQQAQGIGMNQGDIRMEVLRRTLEQVIQQLTHRHAL